jgi:ABC-type enterochelin transport system substrate-binding protein
MPILDELILTALSNLEHALHGTHGGSHHFAIISNGNISTLLKLERSILLQNEQESSRQLLEKSILVLTTVISLPAARR